MDFKAEHWRDSKDYRTAFFKRNKPFLGYIWFCSQCMKPIWKNKGVQVDHIYPPSRFVSDKQKSKGKKNTVLATLLNTEINTVAICPSCNRHKSDKVGFVTIKGAVAKVIHKSASVLQDTLVLTVFVILVSIHKIMYSLLSMFKGKSTKKKAKFNIKGILLPIMVVALFAFVVFISSKL